MKTLLFNQTAFLLGLLFLSLSGCKKNSTDAEEPYIHNEEELITTVELTLDGDSVNSAFSVSWTDADGAGGNPPVIDTLFLKANSQYSVAIKFLDESGDHAHDITHEVEDEAEDHLVCFDANTETIDIKRIDSDGTHEIGLESEWTTGASREASVTISLKHQPEVKDGTCSPGETDVEVVFPVVVD